MCTQLRDGPTCVIHRPGLPTACKAQVVTCDLECRKVVTCAVRRPRRQGTLGPCQRWWSAGRPASLAPPPATAPAALASPRPAQASSFSIVLAGKGAAVKTVTVAHTVLAACKHTCGRTAATPLTAPATTQAVVRVSAASLHRCSSAAVERTALRRRSLSRHAQYAA